MIDKNKIKIEKKIDQANQSLILNKIIAGRNLLLQNIEEDYLNLKSLINKFYKVYHIVQTFKGQVEDYEKQKIAKNMVSQTIQNLWNVIKKTVVSLDSWDIVFRCYSNHKIQSSNLSVKRFKWIKTIENSFQIYLKENKLCIISNCCYIGTNFRWEDQVLILKNTVLLNNTYIGYNTVIFPFCYIGDNVKIGSKNIFYENAYVIDNLKIGNNNIFGKKFCLKRNLKSLQDTIFNYELQSISIQNFHDIRSDFQLDPFFERQCFYCIGNNNVFGDFVDFMFVFSIGNNNIFCFDVVFDDFCEIRDDNIIGRNANIKKPIIICYNTCINAYNYKTPLEELPIVKSI
ncbi:hypothetical protein GVAV_001482 [Gurleya vavrai]